MEKEVSNHKHTNKLIHESSPYLLQHAHNPVDWYPWGEEALELAKKEGKMILVSIGYSACHWCHVMESESFENEEVAAYMNEHFVCIKVDREERPDVDQVYMNAVQLITGRGGWPLNCFALSDGRPFYGGTYFTKKNWLYLLQNVVKEYQNDREKVEHHAQQLTQGIQQSELVKLNDDEHDYKVVLDKMVENWKAQFDNEDGGPNRVPKFPLPNNYEFLLDYGIMNNDQEVLAHVKLTLDKMMEGGIYDQIGGGFSRYSTDKIWKVPHFEKMLYDNAQLVSLYSKAFRHYKDYEYLNTVMHTLNFIERELTGPNGEFYSALDADSEGEEGKYYVWTDEELNAVEGLNTELVKTYYNLDGAHAWEGKYILQRSLSLKEVADKIGYNINSESKILELNMELETNKLKMLDTREKRIHPGLDDKSLTSWNALMISAYTEAYKAKNEYQYRHAALKNASLIWDNMHQGKGKLLHNYKKGKVSIDGFLEDYAATSKAYIDLYQVEFDEVWLERAQTIVEYSMDHFFDKERSMFYFTSDEQSDLIARKMDVNDNVIPASNSIMAHVLHDLGLLTDNSEWVEISSQMLQNVAPFMTDYGSSYSNWGLLLLTKSHAFYEIAISGNDFRIRVEELNDNHFPNTLFVAGKDESDLALLQHKSVPDKTMIYVCVNKSCQLPVEDVKDAVKQIIFR